MPQHSLALRAAETLLNERYQRVGRGMDSVGRLSGLKLLFQDVAQAIQTTSIPMVNIGTSKLAILALMSPGNYGLCSAGGRRRDLTSNSRSRTSISRASSAWRRLIPRRSRPLRI